MKRFILIGLSLLMAGNVFCQAPDGTLDKTQQKKVKEINKQTQKQHDDILKHPTMSAEEKRTRIQASKDERDEKLANVLTPEQVSTVKSKDPVDFDGAVKKVDKQEKAQLKAEKDQKLKDISQQEKALDKQNDDFKRQMEDLKRKQADLKDQQKALKEKRKEINTQYK